MNNVLKHRGYRFYQASYDNDEMGSVLSVNKDWAGTFITYLGYLVLIAGMVVALFVPGTRFAMIAKKVSTIGKDSHGDPVACWEGDCPFFPRRFRPRMWPRNLAISGFRTREGGLNP